MLALIEHHAMGQFLRYPLRRSSGEVGHFCGLERRVKVMPVQTLRIVLPYAGSLMVKQLLQHSQSRKVNRFSDRFTVIFCGSSASVF